MSSKSYAVSGQALLLLLVLHCWCAMTAKAQTQFSVQNTALNTPGGVRFDTEIGDANAIGFLQSAENFIVATFTAGPTKSISAVTLIVEDISGVAYTIGTGNNQAEIHLSASYVENYEVGDSNALVYEITGVLYHESTHVYQNSNGGEDPYFGGVIEGIADYIRLTAGYPANSWSKGPGGNWYDGYSTTAYFLQWIEQQVFPGFVNQLNAKMVNEYTNDFFQQITGQTVDQLWASYQASF